MSIVPAIARTPCASAFRAMSRSFLSRREDEAYSEFTWSVVWPTPSSRRAAGEPGAKDMQEMEQVISARAYALWEAEGRPEGRALSHWLAAERECRAPAGDEASAIPAA